jgi:hypothetical protein
MFRIQDEQVDPSARVIGVVDAPDGSRLVFRKEKRAFRY